MDFSVVIPVYNSTQSLILLTEEIRTYFSAMDASFEIIYVDDFSTASTGTVLKQLSKSEDVRVLFNARNIGQQRTLLKGLKAATGDIVVTMDDDLQHDICALDLVMPRIEAGADLVFGVYEHYGDQATRQLGSKLIGLFFKRKYKALNGNRVSSFRVMKGDLCAKLPISKPGFVYISAELLRHSRTVENIRIQRRARRFGKSGYNLMKCVNITLKLFWFYGLKTEFKTEGAKHEKAIDGRCGKLSNKCDSAD